MQKNLVCNSFTKISAKQLLSSLWPSRGNVVEMIGLLSSHPGKVFSLAEIVDGIWKSSADGGPEYCEGMVQQYAMELRRLGFNLVSHRTRGYSLPRRV